MALAVMFGSACIQFYYGGLNKKSAGVIHQCVHCDQVAHFVRFEGVHFNPR